MAEQQSEGKGCFLTSLIPGKAKPKPFMHIERESCYTLKQKLDVKGDLQAMEYLDAALLLVHDEESSWSEEERKLISKHMYNVTSDSMCRYWPDVRRWSDGVFDSVEKGQTWS